MLEINKRYQLNIVKSFLSSVPTHNASRSISFAKALVIEAQINSITRAYVIEHGYLQLVVDNDGVGTIYLHGSNNPEIPSPRVITPDSFTSSTWSTFTICFMFVGEDTQNIPSLTTRCTELYGENTDSLIYDETMVVTRYNNNSYHNVGYIPMDEYVNTFVFDAETLERTMYGGTIKLVIDGYNLTSTVPLEIDVTSLCDVTENSLYVPFVLPLSKYDGTDTKRGRARLIVESKPLVDLDIYAHNLIDYKISIPDGEAVEDGLVGTVKYSLDVTLQFTVINGNTLYFNENSPQAIMDSLNKNLFESYDIDYFDMTGRYFIVNIHKVKEQIDFSYLPRTITNIGTQPTLTENLTGVNALHSPFRWGIQFPCVFEPQNENEMVDLSTLKIIMDGEDISKDVIKDKYDNGSVLIDIPKITGNVTFTAKSTEKYKLTLVSKTEAPLISDVLYSISPIFDVEIKVIQPVNDTQANIKIYQNDSLIGNHVITIGENKVFYGFALNNNILLYRNTHHKHFDISKQVVGKNLTLTPIVREKQVATDFEMELYQLSGEKNLVDKSNSLISISTEVGTLRESCTIVNPVLSMVYDKVPDFNYVYIPNFNRYYFVTDVTSLKNNLWQISLHVDVLMSFKDGIRSQNCIVARNENDYNSLIEDTERLREKDSDVSVHAMTDTNSPFKNFDPYLDKPFTVLEVIRGKNL